MGLVAGWVGRGAGGGDECGEEVEAGRNEAGRGGGPGGVVNGGGVGAR